jgi:hypothetical protein
VVFGGVCVCMCVCKGQGENFKFSAQGSQTLKISAHTKTQTTNVTEGSYGAKILKKGSAQFRAVC